MQEMWLPARERLQDVNSFMRMLQVLPIVPRMPKSNFLVCTELFAGYQDLSTGITKNGTEEEEDKTRNVIWGDSRVAGVDDRTRNAEEQLPGVHRHLRVPVPPDIPRLHGHSVHILLFPLICFFHFSSFSICSFFFVHFFFFLFSFRDEPGRATSWCAPSFSCACPARRSASAWPSGAYLLLPLPFSLLRFFFLFLFFCLFFLLLYFLSEMNPVAQPCAL